MLTSHRVWLVTRSWSAPSTRSIAFRPAGRPADSSAAAACTRSVCRTRPARHSAEPNVCRPTKTVTGNSNSNAADPNKWLYKRAWQSLARGLTQCRHSLDAIVKSSSSLSPATDGRHARTYLQRPLSALAAVARRLLHGTRVGRHCGAAVQQFVQQSAVAKTERAAYVQHVRSLGGDAAGTSAVTNAKKTPGQL